tara:strand:- start:405 stop:1541 length:1137 start_codon:yes stop_codon:yes gene_type:complete
MSTLLINTEASTTRDSVDIAAPGVDGVSTIQLKDEDGQPLLKPANTVIDVVNNFSWYSGPKASSAALDKQPCAFLIEREQRLSSLISGALYYLNQSKKAFKQAGDALESNGTVKSLLGTIDSNIVMEKAKSMLNKFTGSTGTGITESDSALLANHNLNSIQGIYLTEETGFKYRLPMYSINQSLNNSWGDRQNDSVLTGLVDMATEVVENFSTGYLNISQPGVYIEKPKYFQTGQSGESQTITFPLINTIKRGTQNPVQLNYELLWLLTFQNKSYKTSFSRTPPPKLYTISVPGQFSFPYAYISNMRVDFLGTIRRSTVTVPSLNKSGTVVTTDIKVPVPDAYNVSITFESLIGDYGNTMMSPAFNTNISNGTVSFGS